jgi:hypothetical protein
MASRGSFLSKAYAAARQAGLPDAAARVAASQAALESNYGKSAPGNNFFGIKAGKSWKGATQKLKTWEVVAGKKVSIKDSFRKYDDFKQSFKDWAKVVGRNWPGVLTAQTFEDAVAALKAGLPGGYATDTKYASKLGYINGRIGDALAYSLPDEMDVPRSLAQATAIEQAYRDPFRALDTIQSRPALNMPARPQTLNPPQRLAPAPAGKVTRSALPSIPASLPAAPVGKVDRAPLGPVGQFSKPAPSLQHPTSVAKPTNLAAAPVGKVTKGPALAPATPNASTLAAQYGQYRPSTVTSMPTVATPPSVPVGALPAAKPSTATLAAQYAQYRPGTVPPAPVAPVTPPALSVPPAQVLAPLLAPPKVVKDYPVAEVQQAPAPPRATAYDVYSGMADTALDNTGLNTVSSMPGGGTSVTNQYGATTGMKNGYQTAVGSLPGITGPTASKFGSAVKGAIPGVAGSALGGLLGGPVGALLGAALAKAVTQPGGLLSKQNSFQTDYFGTLNAAKAKGGLGFPGAPSGGYGSGGKMGASFSNNSANGMRGISPAAADAIGKGQGGLY